jgi:hypothetical protein
VVAAGALGGGTAGAADLPRSAAADPVGARTVPAALTRTVALPTGQKLLVGMTGGQVTGYRMLPGPGADGTLLSFGGGGGDTYVVPAEAVGEVGTRLDLARFDVTALARQGAGAADAAAAPVHPDYPLHTLQIDAIGLPGAPADTPLGSIVLNTDDAGRFGTVVPVEDGTGTVQVPAGHYAVYTLFVDHDADGEEAAWREVAQDATVAEGDGTTTVAARESAADVPVSVTTPRPATADVLKLTWFRTGPSGNVTFDSLQIGSPATRKAYVNARPEAAGGSRYVVQWGGASPDAPEADGAYRYDLAFGSDDVPDQQAFRAEPGELATVVQRFSGDPAAGGATGALYVLPVNDETRAVEAGGEAVLPPPVDGARQAVPGTRTEYVGTADGGAWAYSLVTPQLDTFESDIRTLAPGSTRTIDWGHGPLAPNLGVHDDQQLRMCTACAGGGQFDLYLPTADSEPGHMGSLAADYAFALYQDGRQVVSAPDVVGAQGVPATDEGADYRAVLDADRTAAGAGQSTRTHTELAFHDPGPGDPQFALPADVPCPATDCRVMPALTLGYRLDSDQSNTSALTRQTMDLTVGHLSYDGQGSRAAITSAAVSVSFDGGATWQPAALTGSAGTYHATWTNTGSAAPAIKVTAADEAGGSITQTVTDAYGLAQGSLR